MQIYGQALTPKAIFIEPKFCLLDIGFRKQFFELFSGVMSAAIPWDRLEKQYSSMNAYREELMQMIRTETNAFRAGN